VNIIESKDNSLIKEVKKLSKKLPNKIAEKKPKTNI
jgi:hypothetical protein